MEPEFEKNRLGILYVIKTIPWLCQEVLQAVKKVNEERDNAGSWKKVNCPEKMKRRKPRRPLQETPEIEVECSGCRKYFPFTREYFYVSAKTVLSSRCKKCAREYSTGYYDQRVRKKRGHKRVYNKKRKRGENYENG